MGGMWQPALACTIFSSIMDLNKPSITLAFKNPWKEQVVSSSWAPAGQDTMEWLLGTNSAREPRS